MRRSWRRSSTRRRIAPIFFPEKIDKGTAMTWLAGTGQDMRFATRLLLKRRRFASGSSSRSRSALREALRALDPDHPIHDVRTLPARLADSLGRDRFSARTLVLFSVLGLALAGLGL